MSRSNPSANNNTPNPATRWFEWRGGDGLFRYYDKEEEKNVDMKLPFQFIVLDRTSTVRGYNEKAESSIYSNEVRDTREGRLLVKLFKGGKIAEGFWADIKDTVLAKDGKFAVNVYIAYKEGKNSPLALGAIQFTGCSLGAWFEFEKANRKAIFEKAIVVKKFEEDKVGKIEFRVPVFELNEVSEKTNEEAIALDAELQKYFEDYFSRNKTDQRPHPAEEPQPDAPDEHRGGKGKRTPEPEPEPADDVPPPDDDVPF